MTCTWHVADKQAWPASRCNQNFPNGLNLFDNPSVEWRCVDQIYSPLEPAPVLLNPGRVAKILRRRYVID